MIDSQEMIKVYSRCNAEYECWCMPAFIFYTVNSHIQCSINGLLLEINEPGKKTFILLLC